MMLVALKAVVNPKFLLLSISFTYCNLPQTVTENSLNVPPVPVILSVASNVHSPRALALLNLVNA